jgi:membrane protease YdiL (CAAX protease family)
MADHPQDNPERKLPFNNLYLLTGLVTGHNRLWMYFFTITLLVSGYVLFQAVVMLPLTEVLIENGYSREDIIENPTLLFDSNALKMDRNIVLLLELGMFVFGFFGFLLGLKAVHAKTLTSVLTGFEKFRLPRFFFAFGTWAILLIVTLCIELFFFPNDLKLTLNIPGLLGSVLIMLLIMPVQTGLEEIVFRGYLVQGLSQILKNGLVPVILTSLLFGFAHMGNPEVKEYGWPIMLSYYTVFAAFFGLLTLLDEGLELAFGIHFANNFISSILVTSSHSVVKTYSLFETSQEDPYTEIMVWAILATLTFLVFWKKYKWSNFNLIIK